MIKIGFFKLSKKQLEKAKEKPKVKTAYPQKKETGKKVCDFCYNWIVKRYKDLRNPWKKSDERLWKSVCYTLPDFIGIILFFTIFWFLIKFSNNKYGEMRTVHLLILYVVFRLNILIKQIVRLNEKL